MMMQPPKVVVDRSFRRGLSTFNDDRLRWLDEAASIGPLVGLEFGRTTAWVLTDVELARRVLITEAASFVRPLNFTRPTRMAIGDNLFTQSQEQYGEIGSLLSRQLHGEAVMGRADEARSLIIDDVSGWPTGVSIDLEDATSRLALRAACVLLFGVELDHERANEMVRHQRALMSWLGARIGRPSSIVPFAIGKSGRQMRDHRKAFYSGIREIIRLATSTSGGDFALSALLMTAKRGKGLSDDELFGHVAGLIGAGNEVTGATLSWALVYGAQNPDAFQALRTPDGDARAYALESVRLSSCAWSVTRVPIRNVVLSTDEYSAAVAPHSPIIVYLRGLNRSPALWTEPDRFDVARHSPSAGSRRSFIPFGLGARGCPGQQIALAELEAVIPAIARRGRIFVDGPLVEDARFAIRVRGGLTGRLEPYDDGAR